MPIPQTILIGGAASGVGKTSICLGMVRALARRGVRVQTFKVGPDYLDPTYLKLASGRPCYNLDPWMSGEEYVKQLFQRVTADADVAIVEGVMGLFDGADATVIDGSSAHVAKLLGAPVWLVVNAHGMSRSLAALVRGYSHFEEGVRIAGVIANQVGSPRHADILRDALRAAGEAALLGAIKRGALPELQSRHLGLKTASSHTINMELLDRLADAVEAGVPALREISASLQTPAAGSGWGDTEPLACLVSPHPGLVRVGGEGPTAHAVGYCLPPLPGLRIAPACRSPHAALGYSTVTLAVAYDDAFHFYYADNLDALEAAGCRLLRFSPLADVRVPEEADALYLGGGYPEEYAGELESNAKMRESVRAFAGSGRLVYAECGGLMYLSQGLELTSGQRRQMCGVLPGTCCMGKQRTRLGYAAATLAGDCAWGTQGQELRGHEFHYSDHAAARSDGWAPAYQVTYRRGDKMSEGWSKGNVLASYVHLHWASRPQAVERFVQSMRKAAGK